jgi:glycine hydroxymethyltransferase
MPWPKIEKDPLWESITREMQRQEEQIEMIASENYASPEVLKAQGSILTNKYAEGYSGRRYYGGCCYVDEVEDIAIARAKALFAADYVNVQPYSGSQANAAVMMALLSPSDVILGMDLASGGHLTHGSTVNYSGRLYQAYYYGVDHLGSIDYQQVEDLAKKHKPKLIIAGFSAFSGIVDWAKFREIADGCGAYLLADMAHVAGLVAANLYPSPIPHAHVVTSTTHKTLRGPRGGLILAKDAEQFAKPLNFAIFPGMQGGPHMHAIAAKAVAFKEAQDPEFITYQKQVLENAKRMVSGLQKRGLAVVSGGTENHQFLLDFRTGSFTGKDLEQALEEANITVNKNMVPGDPRSPFKTSGLRFGTPAITTRGFTVSEVDRIVDWIADICRDPLNTEKKSAIKKEVLQLCAQFPVYQKDVLVDVENSE